MVSCRNSYCNAGFFLYRETMPRRLRPGGDIFAEIDTRELFEAMELYEQATKKDGADIVNRAAKNAVIGGAGLKGAMQLTQRAKVNEIKKFDPKQAGKGPTTKRRKRLHYAMAAKDGWKKGGGIGAEAERRHSRRMSAIGFSKAVWIAIAKDFGANLRAAVQVKGCKGTKATPITLKATIQTTDLETEHIERVMSKALQDGVRNAAADMRAYAQKKMAERAAEFSGTGR